MSTLKDEIITIVESKLLIDVAKTNVIMEAIECHMRNAPIITEHGIDGNGPFYHTTVDKWSVSGMKMPYINRQRAFLLEHLLYGEFEDHNHFHSLTAKGE